MLVDDVAAHGGRQQITMKGDRVAHVLVADRVAYMSATTAVLAETFGLSTTTAEQVGERWISIQPTSKAYKAVAVDVTLPTTLPDYRLTGHLTELAPSTFRGQRVVGIQGTAAIQGRQAGSVAGTVYVSQSRTPLPVGATFDAGSARATVTLDHWGERVALCPPQQTVALTALQPEDETATASSEGSTASDAAAIKAVVEALFSALHTGNYSAACDVYTPEIRRTAIAAAEKVEGKTFATCASAVAAITHATPAVAAADRSLGPPQFSSLSIDGDRATVTYSSTVGDLVAHSTVLLRRESGRWLVDRATTLSITRR